MIQTALNDKLIITLTDKIKTSDKREEITRYIGEVAKNCAKLCDKGENLRVLTEYKFLIDNLRKEFNL